MKFQRSRIEIVSNIGQANNCFVSLAIKIKDNHSFFSVKPISAFSEKAFVKFSFIPLEILLFTVKSNQDDFIEPYWWNPFDFVKIL